MTAAQRERRTTAVQRERCLPRRRGQPCGSENDIIVCVRLHDRFHQESSAGKEGLAPEHEEVPQEAQEAAENDTKRPLEPPRPYTPSGCAAQRRSVDLSTPHVDLSTSNTYDIL